MYGLNAGIMGVVFLLIFSMGVSAVGGWSIVSSPDYPNKISNTFTSTSYLSPTDVWAVGKTGNDLNPTGTVGVPLVQHFDGEQWSIVEVALPANSNVVELNDIETISPNNVWAVGSYGNVSSAFTKTLIEHWDGSSWTIVPSPDQLEGSYDSELYAITSVSGKANDIWAVGAYRIPGYQIPILLHWDGVTWKSSKLPAGTLNGALYDVTAINARDVWVVGNNQTNTLFSMHFDGMRWKVVNGPTLNSPVNYIQLNSVSAASKNDVWASGFTYGSLLNPYFYSPFLAHWNGSQWENVTAKFNSDQPFLPYSVAFTTGGIKALGSNDVWVFGDKFDPVLGAGPNLQHWDGSKWTESPVEKPVGYGRITDVDGANGTLWAVGYYSNPYSYPLNLGQHTLVEKYSE